MQWKMRRLLAAMFCAALAAVCLSACGRKDDTREDGMASSQPPVASPNPTADSDTLSQQAEESWLSILQEGQELTAAARRYVRQLNGTEVSVHYPHEAFVPDEQSEEGVFIRGSLSADGPECGLTVTVYDQPRDAVVQQLLDEHPLTRQEDTLVGTAELPAVHLAGIQSGGEIPLTTEYYLVEQNGRTCAVLLYYAPDRQAEVRPWLQAMLNTVEFANE